MTKKLLVPHILLIHAVAYCLGEPSSTGYTVAMATPTITVISPGDAPLQLSATGTTYYTGADNVLSVIVD